MLVALLAIASLGVAFAESPRIFPTAEVLPANHLKFYVHFPEPMREGVFLDYCSLLDERGHPVLEPFRETELWSDDRRRLTLWLHPGRQKAGVNLSTEFGPVLEPGRRYTLRVSGAWRTAAGSPLGKDVEKPFRTGERIIAQLDTADWRIVAPHAGTAQPLEIHFPRPLDRALLQRCIRVIDARRRVIAGTIRIGAGEASWHFTPGRDWSEGAHRLLIEAVLEDLAGNSLARPFEVDLSAPPLQPLPSTATLRFQPRTD